MLQEEVIILKLISKQDVCVFRISCPLYEGYTMSSLKLDCLEASLTNRCVSSEGRSHFLQTGRALSLSIMCHFRPAGQSINLLAPEFYI